MTAGEAEGLSGAIDALTVRVQPVDTPEAVRARLRQAAAMLQWLNELARQPERRAAFAAEAAPLFTPPSFTVKAWPAEVPPAHRGVIEGIGAFFSDPERMFTQLQELERDVLLFCAQGETDEHEALEAALTSWELMFGHGPPKDAPGLTSPEWRELLVAGQLPRDITMHRRGAHRMQTHRVQWNLILREVARAPQRFGLSTVKDVSMPAVLASIAVAPTLEGFEVQSTGGAKSLWILLFDSYELACTSPMFMVRKVMPYLSFDWD